MLFIRRILIDGILNGHLWDLINYVQISIPIKGKAISNLKLRIKILDLFINILNMVKDME